jgi:hypothetical protein
LHFISLVFCVNSWSAFTVQFIYSLSQRPNLTEGPTTTWVLRRSTKEEEEVYINGFGRFVCVGYVSGFLKFV